MTKIRKHHWLFKLWVKTRGFLALLIILAGVLVGTLSLLLPFESLYKDRLIAFLEQQWNMQVEVGGIEGSWQGYGPSFNLQDLSLSGTQSLQLKTASISINLYQWLVPGGERGIDLSINSAELAMIQSGPSVSIKNNGNEQQFSQTLDRLLQAGSLRIDALKLNIVDDNEKPILADITADFLLQQDQTHRALQLKIQEADNEQLEIRAISERPHQLMKTAQWYARFDNVSASFLKHVLTTTPLPQLRVSGELWLTTEAGVITAANGQWQWQQLQPELSFTVAMDYQGDTNGGHNNWRISDIQTDETKLADFNIYGQWQNDISEYRSSQLPISWVARLLAGLALADSNQGSDLLMTADIAGVIEQLTVRFNHQKSTLETVAVDFNDITVHAPTIEVNNLAGSYRYENATSRVRVDSQNGQLKLPNMVRGEINWQHLLAQMDWQHQQPGLLTVNQLWCDCQDFTVNANANLLFSDIPQLQISSHISDVVISELYKYWPHHVWKPNTLEWLDQGLKSGDVTNARLTVQGEMREETFDEGTATFLADAHVEGAEVLFDSDWPVVSEINADTVITAHSITVELHSATTAGIKLKPSEVDIPDFKDVTVNISAHAESIDNQLLSYLKSSPIGGDILVNDDIEIGGHQQLFLRLDIPIDPDHEKTTLLQPEGYIAFNNGFFNWQDFQLHDLNGTVQLDGFKLKPINLKAELAGSKTIINGVINTKASSGVELNITLTGRYGLEQLFTMEPALIPISGDAAWEMSLKNKGEEVLLTAHSDLQGMIINLPSPLSKTENQLKPITVTCQLPCDTGVVQIDWLPLLSAQIIAAKDSIQLGWLQFGALTSEPISKGISGQIDQLNLDAWLVQFNRWSNAQAEKTEFEFMAVDLEIEKLIFMSRSFNDIHLILSDVADGIMVEVTGPTLKGRIDIADDLSRKGITADFDYLHWQEADFETLVEEQNSEIPDIHLWVSEFRFADVPMGSLRMELRNVADGIKVEQLTMKSDLLEINANGEWLRESVGHGTSRFNIVMISERIADFLQSMDFNAPISNAQTLIEMDVYWPGLPAQFDVQKLSGLLNISLGQGQVLDQQPGFGRVLGLFNLTNLPRRLILDFRDVLSDGLHFEQMQGQFTLENGVAQTDNFLIKASAARIYMKGLISFVDKSYDQMITIRPQIGKTFPTLGAIAGGPVGAAAGFLVQGLIGKQLRESSEINYKVTGSWEQPIIELLDDKND